MAYLDRVTAEPAVKTRASFHPVSYEELRRRDHYREPVDLQVLEGTIKPTLHAHIASDQVVYHLHIPQIGVGVLGYTGRVLYRDRNGERRDETLKLQLYDKAFNSMFTLKRASPKYHAMLVLEPDFGPQH